MLFRSPGAAPSVADKDKDEDKDKDKDKDKDEDEDKDKDEDEKDEGGDGEDTAEDPDAVGGQAGAGSSGKKPNRKSKSKSGSTKKPASNDPLAGFDDPPPKKGTAKKPTSSKKGDVSVDCILDPSKCKKGGSSKKPSGGNKPAPADSNLPATLSSSDIRAGVAPYKSAAKVCGGKHGASKGTKVKVKLSISGATGTVASARAEPPHNGTPLGNCVAAAVKKSKFKKFQKSQLGAVYPFTM